MREPDPDPRLRLIDLVLTDLAVRSAMFVARRVRDGDHETFVIQTGEEGRFRLGIPDLGSDASIEATVAQAQSYLGGALKAPVPLCPLHPHALSGAATGGALRWVCPDGEWECALGDYEELTWPQRDVRSLSGILSRRLQRRGRFPAVRTIGVRQIGDELVADFGLIEVDDQVLEVLDEIAAPLPVTTHESQNIVIRVRGPIDPRDR